MLRPRCQSGHRGEDDVGQRLRGVANPQRAGSGDGYDYGPRHLHGHGHQEQTGVGDHRLGNELRQSLYLSGNGRRPHCPGHHETRTSQTASRRG